MKPITDNKAEYIVGVKGSEIQSYDTLPIPMEASLKQKR